ncbi:alpha/beta hydrolase [Dactylosporangium sp. NBC_01737]|uniref:alpha/beta fold hydrolase n=1 Tax=Dactylosporangium sp. NBC_01737 TaxID=2975959 RepID=UPI002E0D4236|nr:alpha/beta hydrolase [Dactylosporangium sp. NBC_01737]
MTHYRTINIAGLSVFYREAGDPGNPTLLLLHGFPASSFMFRDLIEKLSSELHIVAPDYPGFGHSDAPQPDKFDYTFDHLADVIAVFTDKLGLDSYALYMQDFGGPVGFRLAHWRPERISFLIVQNANAYEEGLPDSFWAPVRTLWRDPSAANREMIRQAGMSDEALRWNYTHGTADPTLISPDSWVLQQALLGRPGSKDAILDLLYDYRTNPELYSQWQQYFRDHQPPTLIVWGKQDVIFPEAGAHPFRRDLNTVDFNLLDTGHFALEDHGDIIAAHIRRFARTVASGRRSAE